MPRVAIGSGPDPPTLYCMRAKCTLGAAMKARRWGVGAAHLTGAAMVAATPTADAVDFFRGVG